MNGLLTYDREVMKIPEEILREINAQVSGVSGVSGVSEVSG